MLLLLLMLPPLLRTTLFTRTGALLRKTLFLFLTTP